VVLDAGKVQDTQFCAAKAPDGGIWYVCAGRFRNPDLAAVAPVGVQEKIALDVGQAPVAGSPKTKRVLDFIAKYQRNPGAQINWGSELTPRKIQGKDVMDYGGTGKDITGAVVWGEGCDGTRHFDCRTFVRSVVLEVTGVQIAGLINILTNEKGLMILGEPAGVKLKPGDAMESGDVLYYDGHVAFAIADVTTKYSPTATYRLAQAECGSLGVTFGSPHPQNNIGCVRLSPNVLLNRKVT
jgi:hypothetical protein